ncbi:MAG: lysylphosphatidylglycerol synthase transmembrane domain-containing protein [Kofleriaceae bacterium]
MKKHLATILRVVVICLVAIGLFYFVKKIDWHKLGHELAHAKAWPLVLAAALNFVLLIGKAVTWRIMFAPRYQVSTMRLTRYTIVAFAASVLAPARAGELLRVWMLKKRDGVPTADTAAVAIAEKLLDGATMLLLVSPLPWLLPDLPHWVTDSILICSGIALVAFVGFVIAQGRIKDPKSWFARFIAGMHVLRSPGRLVSAMGVLMIVWLADWAMIALVAYAVDIQLSGPAGLLILFTLNLAITAPSTPAGVGALEVGVLGATKLLDIPDEKAFALALLYHALQIFPLLAVGLSLEWRLVLGREDIAVA